MKIASVGMSFEYGHESIDDINFKSNTTFLDHDLLIWDPNSLPYEYAHGQTTYNGYPCLDDDNSARILRDILRRREEMTNMLELGRSIVICTPEPKKCCVATGEKEYSGTGRNRQTTRMVKELDLLYALPLPNNIETVAATGKSMEIREVGPFTAFWEKNKNYLEYKAYCKTSLGKPFLFIKGTQLVVGTYLKINNGNLVLIPSFGIPEDTEGLSGDEEFKAEEDFITSLISLVDELKQQTGDFELPSWSKEYILPGELEAKNTLTGLEKNLEEILTQISGQKKYIAELEKNKLLITGTGRALEIQVKKVFEELGFTAKEGLPGRDDLILAYNEKVAVVEVKGVTKSGAEKHAAQLEKWVSQYYLTYNTKPKAILIVNTFRDIPLLERNETSFPEQMLDYCEKRGHCLITGRQLLSLYLDCKNNDEKKSRMIEIIFNTDGIIGEYQNWSDHIKFESEVNELSDRPEQ